jgi:membrane associated rhomboid family serine protease
MNNYSRGYSSNPIRNFIERSAVNKIIAANVIVFILQLILQKSSFMEWFILHPKLVLTRGYVWQLFTYMFLHAGISHIGLNMLIFWMFGTQLEKVWGSTQFLKYYLVCGLGGALFSFIFAYHASVLGASAAVYGVLMAYAILFPYNQIYIMGVIPIRARTLVIILAVMEFLSGIGRQDGIAHFAHLGGMATGLIYIHSDYRTTKFWRKIKGLFDSFPLKIKLDKENNNDEPKEFNQQKVDSILDKISEKGYGNLTETEKRILEQYSNENKNK